jgi:hypothetical protein
MWYFVSLALQNVLHMPALLAGAAMAPFAVALATCARLAPRLAAHSGARAVIAVGSLLSAAGFAWLSRLDAHSQYLTAVLGPGLLISAGAGLVIAPVVTATTVGVAPGDAGIASAVINAARQIGGSLGLSILSAIAAAAPASTASPAAGLASGYGRAFAAASAVSALTAAAVLMLARDDRNGDSHA